jgi:hypothetical protein
MKKCSIKKDMQGKRCYEKAYACWFKLVDKIFTMHEKSHESGTKSEEFLVLRPSNQEMLYQNLFRRRWCCFFLKKSLCLLV